MRLSSGIVGFFVGWFLALSSLGAAESPRSLYGGIDKEDSHKLVEKLRQIIARNDRSAYEYLIANFLLSELLIDRSPKAAFQYLSTAQMLATRIGVGLPQLDLMNALILYRLRRYSESLVMLDSTLNKKSTDLMVGRLKLLNLIALGESEKLTMFVTDDEQDFDPSLIDDDLLFKLIRNLGGKQATKKRTMETLATRSFWSKKGLWALKTILLNEGQVGARPYSFEFLSQLRRVSGPWNGYHPWVLAQLDSPITKDRRKTTLHPLEKLATLVKWHMYPEAETFSRSIVYHQLSKVQKGRFHNTMYKLYQGSGQFGKLWTQIQRLKRLGHEYQSKQAWFFLNWGLYSKAFDAFSKLAEKKGRQFFSWEAVWSLILMKDYDRARIFFKNCFDDPQSKCFRKGKLSKAIYWYSVVLERTGHHSDSHELLSRLVERPDGRYFCSVAPLPLSEQNQCLGLDSPEGSSPAVEPFLGVRPVYQHLNGSILLSDIVHRLGNSHSLKSMMRMFLTDTKPRLAELATLGGVSWAIGYYRGQVRALSKAVRLVGNQKEDNEQDQESSASYQKLMYPLAYKSLVQKSALRYAVDPFLIYSVMRAESFYESDANSVVGARGVLQIMPSTALEIAKEQNLKEFNVRELTIPSVNIPMSGYYLRRLIDYYRGNIVVALAAYNAGPAAVDRWLKRYGSVGVREFVDAIPYGETRRYVKKVIRFYKTYSMLYLDGEGLRFSRSLPTPKGGLIY